MVPRPAVVINMAASVDGKITSAAREYPRLTSAYDKRLMDRIRAEADALLIGAGTVRADDPPLNVRDAEMQAHRSALGKPPTLPRFLLSRSLDVPLTARFFAADEARRVVVTTTGADTTRADWLSAHAEIWRIGDSDVDLVALTTRLAAEGIGRLLVEGGGEVNACFVEADLVDEIYLTIAPSLLGGRDAPTLLEGDGLAMASRRQLELIEITPRESELYCHYRVVREGQDVDPDRASDTRRDAR